MRIIIDLQGAQTGSCLRGIGRYSTAIAKAIIQNRGDHEIFILLNGLFEGTINPIKNDFSSILPADHIGVFSIPSPVEAFVPENAWRMEAAELIREWVIDQIAPDVLMITSLFEGPTNNSVTSIRHLETSVKIVTILYDLIPYLDPEPYLSTVEVIKWYYSKISSLRRADLLLAISESARYEAVDALAFDASRIVTIYPSADERFTVANISPEVSRAFLERMGIRRRFVMHASAFELRKNFEGLIRAFGLLPKPLRESHQLVLVTAHDPDSQIALRRIANEAGLGQDELVLTGYVSDSTLVTLYSLCTLFVFPSFHEGFGLPALEAMCCGAATIGSNTTSIPEVIGREDVLFDPHSDQSMAKLMQRALTDEAFRESLKTHALQQSKRFSWDRSAKLALRAIEEIAVPDHPQSDNKDISVLLDRIAAIKSSISPTRKDFIAVSQSIAKNERVACELNPALIRGKSGRKVDIDHSWTDGHRFTVADTHREGEGGQPYPRIQSDALGSINGHVEDTVGMGSSDVVTTPVNFRKFRAPNTQPIGQQFIRRVQEIHQFLNTPDTPTDRISPTVDLKE
jgi:glycosyltransferase involved in cell wall biosynthesis